MNKVYKNKTDKESLEIRVNHLIESRRWSQLSRFIDGYPIMGPHLDMVKYCAAQMVLIHIAEGANAHMSNEYATVLQGLHSKLAEKFVSISQG